MRILAAVLLIGLASETWAEGLSSCIKIEDNEKRLECYDKASGFTSHFPNEEGKQRFKQVVEALAICTVAVRGVEQASTTLEFDVDEVFYSETNQMKAFMKIYNGHDGIVLSYGPDLLGSERKAIHHFNLMIDDFMDGRGYGLLLTLIWSSLKDPEVKAIDYLARFCVERLNLHDDTKPIEFGSIETFNIEDVKQPICQRMQGFNQTSGTLCW